MTEKRVLTRRRSREGHQEVWHVFYGDVRVGSIGERPGVPHDVDQWGWTCGFYPGVEPADYQQGSAATFDEARRAFEAAWREILPQLTEVNFDKFRRQRALTAWLRAMHDAGCTVPTATTSGRSTCFCGASIDLKTTDAHVIAAHLDMQER